MANLLSPGISVNEVDLSTSTPATATTIGAFAGKFSWGPANEVVTVSNEDRLVSIFGKPTDANYEYWFSAANFLLYSNNLKTVRAVNLSESTNAVSGDANNAVLIQNSSAYESSFANNEVTNAGTFAAKYPGELGNALTISICPNASAFSANLSSINVAYTSNSSVTTGNTTFQTSTDLTSVIQVGDSVSLTLGNVTTEYVSVTNVSATTVTVSPAFRTSVGTSAHINRRWKYFSQFTDAPRTSDFVEASGGANDEIHVVVVDTTGAFSNRVPGTVLERFAFVSKAQNAVAVDGSNNYWKNVINSRSRFAWVLTDPTIGSNWGSDADTTFTETATSQNVYNRLNGGADGNVSTQELTTAYAQFASTDTIDVSLIVSGPASETLASYLITVAENRADCMVYISPERSDVVENSGAELDVVIAHRNALPSSSYAFMDNNWKYIYDRYNDKYRWIPGNSDTAGRRALISSTRDPWFSISSNDGTIKNVVKLAWNADQAARDSLYAKGINTIVTFTGEGTRLYGDKTLLSRPSSFDREGVRWLFIVLRKTITRAARNTLFEFNDSFTRAQFVSLVEPFLRDVQGRRGIQDFRVVCDERNNTPEVIAANEFVGDIYVKPNYSTNFIKLNFMNVRAGVSFDEVIGQF